MDAKVSSPALTKPELADLLAEMATRMPNAKLLDASHMGNGAWDITYETADGSVEKGIALLFQKYG